MTKLYRRKTEPVEAVQITSQDVNDLPRWAREAHEDEEVYAYGFSYIPLESPEIIGSWAIVSNDPHVTYDVLVLTNDDFLENYEEVSE